MGPRVVVVVVWLRAVPCLCWQRMCPWGEVRACGVYVCTVHVHVCVACARVCRRAYVCISVWYMLCHASVCV